MSVAFLYPGQGAQVPGMLHQLSDRAEATWTLQEASQVLGHDVLTLDTKQALSSTVSVQLALFVSGVAATRIMQAEGVKPDVVAGLSVGAFAAAVAAARDYESGRSKAGFCCRFFVWSFCRCRCRRGARLQGRFISREGASRI